VTFRPRNVVEMDNQDGYGFNEYRVLGTFREPKIFGTMTDALLTGFVEQAVRSSFNFIRRAVQAEAARRVSTNVTLVGRYSFERTRLFDERYNAEEKPQIDRFFRQFRLSSVSSAALRDTRDDPLDPTRGMLLSADYEVAARLIGSEVGFLRSYLQSFFFRQLSSARRTVLAGAARVGLATGLPREVIRTDETGRPILGPDGRPLTETVEDLPASERFFAGGSTTVRGFALDRLGTPDTIDSDGFAQGGNALIVLNAELRMHAWKDLGFVGFFDAGNVFGNVSDLRLGDIRPAAGFGLRYRSPLGPIRVDLGFNLDRQFVAGQREEPRQIHISLGHAF
jgi:outer membrane protein insertion porin family